MRRSLAVLRWAWGIGRVWSRNSARHGSNDPPL